ncbi:DNA polymerase III subunit beta [Alloprevotella sp. OH1205_COT-284]|uniref:DNA polymerase III subunit beta n=1 Tax=Alloprevotella sp. OH1205_COT-284 TaxID=2491043 RepID=UPI000F5FEF58|nr:DNA polymerase III subunit beta [Alloprevotella sp. OH1205_COT-284]RRD77326.1 DNA polymerase III subunit beta [Alloprevotella sp. OH1205_COT-284]
MKFVISSSLLSQRLQTLGRVIASKNSMPILDNFLFQIENNRLTLTASDNEITLRTTIELVESDANIDFTVNAKTIQEAIKEIPEQPMEFVVSPDNLEITIHYQNGHYTLMGMSAEEYPLVKELEGDISSLVIDAQRLYGGINRALFAASDDPLRPVMTGIFFDYHSNGLSIVASDSRKLACTRMLDYSIDGATSFILHKKPATIIKGILQKEIGDVSVHFTKRNATIESENYRLSCRLIEGNFPNYNSVIPQSNPNLVTVNRGAMISALRRVLIFSNIGSPLVKLHIEPGRVVLSARDTDYGRSGEESLLCEYVGMPMNIGFKGTLLMDMLNNLEGEEIIIQLADPSRAGVIVPSVQQENEHVLMLLMPMMLNE